MRERFLLIGLGNPGVKYAKTRHNLGFMVIDELAERLWLSNYSKNDSYLVSECYYQQKNLILIKPLTYMNLSGIASADAKKHYAVDKLHLLIIHDDINLPFGKLRLRAKGSDGGHNGISSIIQHLQTQEFPRLKIGVGSKFGKDEMVDYVLATFSKEELKSLGSIIRKAADACFHFTTHGIRETMNMYN